MTACSDKKNCALMTVDKYNALVSEVLKVKREGKSKLQDFWLMQHYDIMKVDNVDKLR